MRSGCTGCDWAGLHLGAELARRLRYVCGGPRARPFTRSFVFSGHRPSQLPQLPFSSFPSLAGHRPVTQPQQQDRGGGKTGRGKRREREIAHSLAILQSTARPWRLPGGGRCSRSSSSATAGQRPCLSRSSVFFIPHFLGSVDASCVRACRVGKTSLMNQYPFSLRGS